MKIIAIILNIALLSYFLNILIDYGGWPAIDDDAFWYWTLILTCTIINLIILFSITILKRGWFVIMVISRPMRVTVITLNICLLLCVAYSVEKAVKDDNFRVLCSYYFLLFVSTPLTSLFTLFFRKKTLTSLRCLSEKFHAVERGGNIKAVAVILNIGLLMFPVIDMADGGQIWPVTFWFALFWITCPIANLIALLLAAILKRTWSATKFISKPVNVIAAILNICLLLYTVHALAEPVKDGRFGGLTSIYAILLLISCTSINLIAIFFTQKTLPRIN